MALLVLKISAPRVGQALLYILVHSTGTLRIISDHLQMSSFHLSSYLRGYHVYKDVWTASAKAVLQCEQESGNNKDPYVAAVQKDSLTVGHISCTISYLCSVFVQRNGLIVCTITDARKCSTDLPRKVWNCLALTPSMILNMPSRR